MEKVNRIKGSGINKISNFYSDSLSDKPMALISSNAYLVKKDKVIPWDI